MYSCLFRKGPVTFVVLNEFYSAGLRGKKTTTTTKKYGSVVCKGRRSLAQSNPDQILPAFASKQTLQKYNHPLFPFVVKFPLQPHQRVGIMPSPDWMNDNNTSHDSLSSSHFHLFLLPVSYSEPLCVPLFTPPPARLHPVSLSGHLQPDIWKLHLAPGSLSGSFHTSRYINLQASPKAEGTGGGGGRWTCYSVLILVISLAFFFFQKLFLKISYFL